ncbi:hypothetical protein HYH03_000898 [Edaphochlamys debaryana]|uniref:Centrosomal protein of 44 kDa n=1 Tax=Edaphochlamys debaryana TaxID=47281 RepID=A0A835YM72_9CHLO|nr:hypothetical protein HYH03_000898 [Edaphochlamys debaryana]|eukprot:KAG2501080.1 hypothetical protein HYH03_000898 [Edaphochlamys debaryana]
MATGDLAGNVQRLLRELKAIKYPGDVDEVGLRLGDPVALLPLLSFALLKFSRHVARFIVRSGFELAGKTDQRFVESSFRLFRDVLNVRTVVTPAQFFEQGFAERKVILLCDVIAVCKKVHNDEVRQERLAALKATRQPAQEHVSTRLASQPRRSPIVKVVRNSDDVEVHQVFSAQHLPNASDGAQSVYKAKRTVTTTRSPSPSPAGFTGAAGPSSAHRSQGPASRPRSAQKEDPLEITLNPASTSGRQAAPRPGAGAGRTPATAATAPPPIHSWFLNPAFDGGEEGDGAGSLSFGLGASIGLGGTGRPDSSAWWQTAAAPAPAQPSAPWWQPSGAGPGGQEQALSQAQAHPAGAQPAWASSLRPTATVQRHAPVPTPGIAQTGGPGVRASPAAGAAAGSGGSAAGSAFMPRDVDEWSFSRYFGPGKVPGAQRQEHDREGGAADGTGAVQELAEEGEQAAEEGYTDGWREAEGQQEGQQEDLERDGPVADQDRRGEAAVVGQGPYQAYAEAAAAGARPSPQQHYTQQPPQPQPPYQQPWWSQPAARDPVPPQPAAPTQAQATALQQQPRPYAAPAQQPGGPSNSGRDLQAGSGYPPAAYAHAGDGAGAAPPEWPAALARMERETQLQLQQLRDKLAAAEEELDKLRVESRQSRDALQARVTLLEGRVRFLECELDLCVKRQPGTESSPGRPASSPERSPAAASAWHRAGAGAESGAAGRSTSPGEPWRSPPRPHSAGAGQGASALPRAGAPPPAAAPAAAAAPAWTQAGGAGGQHALAASHPAGSGAAAHGQRPLWESAVASGGGASWRGAEGQGGRVPSPAGAPPAGAAAGGAGLSAAPLQPSAVPIPTRSSASSGPRLGSFTPMPQPAFSFQPGSLMHQVQAATTGAGAAEASPLVAPDPLARYGASSVAGGPAGSRQYGGSLDSSAGAAGAPTAGASWSTTAGAQAVASVRSSADAALPAGTGAAAGNSGAAGAAAGGWRPAERPAMRAGGAGSILDAVGVPAATAPPAPAPTQPAAFDEAPATVGARMASFAFAAPPPTGGAGGVPASAGPGSAAGSGAFRNTDDLINSLYVRYTEAQDFLQSLRRR